MRGNYSHPRRQGPFKRRSHKKTRTGCKTCKIRRVRCDETKPHCLQCSTTGRACDGYATTLVGPLPRYTTFLGLNPTNDQPLIGTGRPMKESRGFQYFFEVTGPSLAGALDVQFWLMEVPMICQEAPALWHGVVSLASAHESYVSGSPASSSTNMFALHQFNSSVRHLLSSYSCQNWWVYLMASTIFACICVLEDKYNEAQMHYESGYSLLRHFDTAPPSNSAFHQLHVAGDQKSDKSLPVSISSLRSILVGFEVRLDRSGDRRVSQLKSLLDGENNYCSWRRYTSPLSLLAPRSSLTSETLRRAICAAESLYFDMALGRRQRARRLRELYKEDRSSFKQHWESRSSGDAIAYHQFSNELSRVLKVFRADLEKMSRRQPSAPNIRDHLAAVMCLELVHLTNQLYLQDFNLDNDAYPSNEDGTALDVAICNMAEEIIGLEKTCDGCKRSGSRIASTTVMNVLVSIAQRGCSENTRCRARRLLRQPRTEVSDMLMAAGFADAISTREKGATKAYTCDDAAKITCMLGPSFTVADLKPRQEDEIHPMAHICHSDIAYGQGREAKVILSTWWEWLEGEPGQEIVIKW